jgi:hypothetical protein
VRAHVAAFAEHEPAEPSVESATRAVVEATALADAVAERVVERLGVTGLSTTRVACERGTEVSSGNSSSISVGQSTASNLSEVAFAKVMGVSPRTIASDRKYMTEEVHYHRHGRRVLYHAAEAEAFLRHFKRPLADSDIQRLAIDEVTQRRARVALRRKRGAP